MKTENVRKKEIDRKTQIHCGVWEGGGGEEGERRGEESSP